MSGWETEDQAPVNVHAVVFFPNFTSPAWDDCCEVCGEGLARLQVRYIDGEPAPAGPWYEAREHQRNGGTHHWWQQHNCIKQPPDQCPFCEQAQRPGYDPTVPTSLRP